MTTILEQTYAQIRQPLLRLMERHDVSATMVLIGAFAEIVGSEIVAAIGPHFGDEDVTRWVHNHLSTRVESLDIEAGEAERAMAELVAAELSLRQVVLEAGDAA